MTILTSTCDDGGPVRRAEYANTGELLASLIGSVQFAPGRDTYRCLAEHVAMLDRLSAQIARTRASCVETMQHLGQRETA